jgi:CDP-Glycerol:Poly(glycerophosphate) glycerophosphotransferase
VRSFGYEFDKIDPAEGGEFPEESSYWYSVPHCRTVLAVVRSVNTTLTLLDLLPDLLQDHRVQTVFTVMARQRDANFEQSMRRLIAEAGVREIPWEEATERSFDLVLTASYEGLLSELSGPIVVFNHGAGAAKYLSLPPDGRVPVSADGTSTTTMVLSHSEQRAYYAGGQDERVRFLAAGDPWRDRLCASKHRAGTYRAALGIADGTRLVALSSTWGEYSLIATNPDLPLKLLAALPRDEYRVALILHPNVWFGHSTWQIRAWLREAMDAGLLLVPPRDAWRGVLVAADALVGDHGSVMLHAAALDLPVAFGCLPNDELIEGGPSAELEARAPRLDLHSSLAPQIERLIAEHDPELTQLVAGRVFEHPGESHAILRRAIYGMLEMDEPDYPPRVLAVDLPQVLREEVTAHRVRGQVAADGSVTLERFPVVRLAGTPPPPPAISPSRMRLRTFGSSRPLRWCYDATPTETESGASAPCAKTRRPRSARPWPVPADRLPRGVTA